MCKETETGNSEISHEKQFLIETGNAFPEPTETESAVQAEAEELMSLRRDERSASGDEEDLLIFIPTTPGDHYQKALRRCG